MNDQPNELRFKRINLLKKIEELTNSRVLIYITGDRRGLETRISSDVIPVMFKLLSKFGDTKKINLFLYTTGGIIISGFGIVNIIREFCEEFGIIIPFKALSTGTLMALGANEIIMSKMGQLGPVDPSINHPLAPSISNPQNQAVKVAVPVNVEDVLGYLDLAKNEANINTNEGMTGVFKSLSDNVHPVALGAVNRARNQIKFLAKTLLSYHLKDNEQINKIINTLVEERFSHDYLIGRKEAKNEIGLNIVDVPNELNEKILELYGIYSDILRLDSPYSAELELGQNDNQTISLHRGIIESTDSTYVYTTQKNIRRIQVEKPGIPFPIHQFLENLRQEGWSENNSV